LRFVTHSFIEVSGPGRVDCQHFLALLGIRFYAFAFQKLTAAYSKHCGCHGPESYTGGTVATGRIFLAGHIEREKPD
jgi:hypothetical protein